MKTTTTILACRAAEARKRAKKFEKKAARYGVPFTVSFGPVYEDERTIETERGVKKVMAKVQDVTVEGEKPVVGDFAFQASIEITPNGNYVDMIPGLELDPKYRTVDGHCEHCRTQRRRKHVFVVRNVDTGESVQVGRTCLRDFLGIDDPKWIMNTFKFWRSVGDDDEGFGGFGRYEWSESLQYLLARTNACIRIWGWTSKGMARDDEDLIPTIGRVLMSGFTKETRAEVARINAEMCDGDDAIAGQVIEWVRANTQDNDYMHNLRLSFHDDVLDSERHAGLAISAVAAWHRALERELRLAKAREKDAVSAWQGEKKDAVSAWQGEKKERLKGVKVTLEMVRSIGDNGYGGWTRLLKFRDEAGNLYTWFTASETGIDIGEQAVIDGTVKDHTEYKGVRETLLTRVAVLSPEAMECAA